MKKPSFAVRRATEADFEQLCELYAEVDALHRKARPDLFRKARKPARPRPYIAKLIGGPDSAVFVAQRGGGRLAGFVVVELHRTSDGMVHKSATIASIDVISVRATYRRFGLGRRMLAHANRWAQKRGATAMALGVYEFNRGPIDFYEAMGFRTIVRTMERKLPRTSG
jgi:ribosomal protein S18 acetylase RimI-like enzyme